MEDGTPIPYLILPRMFSVRDGRIGVTCERYPEGGDCSRKLMCRSARMIMYLGPDGRILPCLAMSESDAMQKMFPQIGETSLAEALTDSLYRQFGNTHLGTYLDANPECVTCEYRNRCAGGCRALAALASMDELFTARFERMGADFARHFQEDGAIGHICGLYEQMGVADDRWRSAEHALFAVKKQGLLGLGQEEIMLSTPNCGKAKWIDGVPQPAKFYLLVNVLE
ncbi:MAG: SPASM domain-containing protein [Coriobacteriia bacterium]|nr:SPASM domain-containing protein [Coriobacteriia bacterium]